MTKHRGVVIRFFKVFGVAAAIVFTPYLLGDYLPLRDFLAAPRKPDMAVAITWVVGLYYVIVFSVCLSCICLVLGIIYRLYSYITTGGWE